MRQRLCYSIILSLIVYAVYLGWGQTSAMALTGDSVLKGSITQLSTKVGKLTDLIVVVGAVGASLGFALLAVRMTVAGWSMESFKKCKVSFAITAAGIVLATMSKLLAAIIYAAIKPS